MGHNLASAREPSVNVEVQLRALLFQEGDVWVVQGVEYDICAHGADIPKARLAFERALVEHCLILEHLGRKPMEGVPPAPDRFWAMFEDADEELQRVKAPTYPSAPPVRMRLAHAA